MPADNTKNLRTSLRGFRRKRVALDRFVKEFYVEGGLAYISLKAKDYDSIISCYSVDGLEDLEPAFSAAIEENAVHIPTEYPILLEICGGGFNEEQKDTIEKSIADHYALNMGEAQLALEDNKKRILFITALTVVSAIIIYGLLELLPVIPRIVSDITTIVFWVFLWTLVDTAVFQRSDLKRARTEAAQLASMKVKFVDKFENALAKPAEKKAILDEMFEEDIIVPSTEWKE